MSGARLLIGFLVATLGWQYVARMAGPPLAKWFYRRRVAARRGSGLTFESESAMKVWAEKAAASSLNLSLLALAAGCGAVAGILNFPLIGFSRSVNGRSWLRIITLCAVSWLVAVVLYPSFY